MEYMGIPPMKQGLSPGERDQLRGQIREKLLAEAEGRARIFYVSLACRTAIELEQGGVGTPDQIRIAHAKCLGETAGNGCLDPCHDPGYWEQPEPVKE
jgi:hypothetical protein